METTKAIMLTQAPVIIHKLSEIGNGVTKRMAELNIPNLLATEDTIQTLKQTRAELNKEANVWEVERKAIKEAVMGPYSDFEAIYKAEIIDKYKEADAILKTKIGDFELRARTDKRNNIVAYFDELKAAEKLDFLSFDALKIEVNLSTSEKKYKEQVLEAVTRIMDDLSLINTETHASEMLVEYHKTLNVGESIKTVRKRKEDIRLAEERMKMEEAIRRKSKLSSMAFAYHDITRTYNWVSNEELMVSLSDLETLSKEEWESKMIAIETTIKEATKPQGVKAPVLAAPTVQAPIPVEAKKEELCNARFEVEGTYAQLKALGEYMKSNGLNYKNI